MTLWNLSGSYSMPYGTAVLRQDGKGSISVSYDSLGTGNTQLVGTVRSAGSGLKMRLSAVQAVPQYIFNEGLDFWAQRKDRFALSFDSSLRMLDGMDRISLTREETIYYTPNSFWEGNQTKVVRTTTFTNQPVTLAVPEATDGHWTLTLEIVPEGRKLSGTGIIRFSSEVEFGFHVVGSYSPTTGKSKLLLRGDGADKGANLLLSLAGTEMKIERMRGMVAGQRIHFQ